MTTAQSTPKLFVETPDVTVTSALVTFQGKIYALAHVTSVKMEIVPKNYLPCILIVLIGLIVGIMGAFDRDAPATICGFIACAVGVIAAFFVRDRFVVRMYSASGESSALVSNNEGYIRKIRDGISSAIIDRG